jgi:hypothetical protein
MSLLRPLAFLFLTGAVLAQQPTPLLPDPKLTPGDVFEVTAQDICVPGYAKKVRAVPAWLKRKQASANPAAADDVWVNTRSGKFRRPGSRFYGKTKQGEYMPELDALDRGYSPAGGAGE